MHMHLSPQCLQHLDVSVLGELVPRLCELLKSGVGLGTKVLPHLSDWLCELESSVCAPDQSFFQLIPLHVGRLRKCNRDTHSPVSTGPHPLLR